MTKRAFRKYSTDFQQNHEVINLDRIRSNRFYRDRRYTPYIIFDLEFSENINCDDIYSILKLKKQNEQWGSQPLCVGISDKTAQMLDLLGLNKNFDPLTMQI